MTNFQFKTVFSIGGVVFVDQIIQKRQIIVNFYFYLT